MTLLIAYLASRRILIIVAHGRGLRQLEAGLRWKRGWDGKELNCLLCKSSGGLSIKRDDCFRDIAFENPQAAGRSNADSGLQFMHVFF